LLLSSFTLELARRSMIKKEEFAAMGIIPPRFRRDLPLAEHHGFSGLLLSCGTGSGMDILRAQGAFLASNPSRSLFLHPHRHATLSILWEDWSCCFYAVAGTC